jgi:carbon-monoxide dehydrogenase medium subunit
MSLSSFDYLEPQTVREACEVLAQYPDSARPYAGGTSLLLLMKQGIVQIDYLVNIKKIDGIRGIHDENGRLRIGALTTHRDLEVSPVIRKYLPAITEAEPEIANIRVRTTGTVGGNLAFAAPLTDLPPIFIALDAQARIESATGTRTIPVQDVFAGYYESTLAPDELIVELEVKKTPPHFGLRYQRFSAGSDKPAVGCAVAVRIDPGTGVCADARVVLGCVAPTPLRVHEAEAALIGKPYRAEIAEEVAAIASRACSPLSDIRGSEDYKRSIAGVLARRSVAEAFQRARQDQAGS